ncbi:1833_t:CDS:1, partial [Paraglomus brasilianum]
MARLARKYQNNPITRVNKKESIPDPQKMINDALAQFKSELGKRDADYKAELSKRDAEHKAEIEKLESRLFEPLQSNKLQQKSQVFASQTVEPVRQPRAPPSNLITKEDYETYYLGKHLNDL